jgi:hypothetical protein
VYNPVESGMNPNQLGMSWERSVNDRGERGEGREEEETMTK